MSIAGFPTSSDIYLEVDGVKVAVVQSYSAKASKTSSAVEAFGESEPVATVPGQTSHVLELTRIIYSDCQWSSISEAGTLGAMVVEKVTIVASKRIETGV